MSIDAQTKNRVKDLSISTWKLSQLVGMEMENMKVLV